MQRFRGIVGGLKPNKDGGVVHSYLDGRWSDIKQFNELNELDLENLINIFEGQPFYERDEDLH